MTTITKWLLVFFLAVIQAPAQQRIFDNYNDGFYNQTREYNYRFKISAYFFTNYTFGFSAGFSNWLTYTWFQPSETFSVNAIVGPKNLGNRGRRYNQWQFNVIASTVLTVAFTDKKMLHYAEINPFYFGNSTASFQNYKHSVTFGTTFVTMPKGKGYNIVTPRNRSQQLIYFQWKYHDFQFNLYEDYLVFTDKGLFAFLADNRDRYYTGGGNLQWRASEDVTLKYYTEIYTGNSYVDRDDHPDLLDMNDTNIINGDFYSHPWGAIGPRRYSKYAYQDPGQIEFNQGRNFFAVQFHSRVLTDRQQTLFDPTLSNENVQIMFALQGGADDMYLQNLIHSISKVDRDIVALDKKGNIKKDKKGNIILKADRLHLFQPATPSNKSVWKSLKQRFHLGLAFTSDFVTSPIDETLKP